MADTTPVNARPACVPTAAPAVEAKPVAGIESDVSITSFDGTIIRAHWFPLPTATGEKPAPTVLMGSGWGSAGDTDLKNPGLLGAVSISVLRDAGYNVLTWDPRGFSASTGTITIDSPDYEGSDARRLLDWIATMPLVQLDTAGDPRVGMVGVSYGGGIQLVTAAADCRVDAIVPIIALHSLITSLFKADTAKTGWAGILTLASIGRQLDPTIMRVNAASKDTGVIDPADQAWFEARGPGDLVGKITAPTLIIQGTADYPVPAGDPLIGTGGTGTLALKADGGAGPLTSASTGSILDAVVGPTIPVKATNAVNVSIIAPATTAVIVGAPELTLDYSGTTPDGPRPTRVFAQLIDEATGQALGNQITPIEVTLDGQVHTVIVPLEAVAYTATAATKLTLQIVATTTAYAQPRFGGSIDFSKVSVSLPTGTGLTTR